MPQWREERKILQKITWERRRRKCLSCPAPSAGCLSLEKGILLPHWENLWRQEGKGRKKPLPSMTSLSISGQWPLLSSEIYPYICSLSKHISWLMPCLSYLFLSSIAHTFCTAMPTRLATRCLSLSLSLEKEKWENLCLSEGRRRRIILWRENIYSLSSHLTCLIISCNLYENISQWRRKSLWKR